VTLGADALWLRPVLIDYLPDRLAPFSSLDARCPAQLLRREVLRWVFDVGARRDDAAGCMAQVMRPVGTASKRQALPASARVGLLFFHR
jgi:hypothetical protein